jgi:hypothetical protein
MDCGMDNVGKLLRNGYKGDEMHELGSIHREMRYAYKILTVKFKRMRPLWKRSISEMSVKMYLKETGLNSMDWIQPTQNRVQLHGLV